MFVGKPFDGFEMYNFSDFQRNMQQFDISTTNNSRTTNLVCIGLNDLNTQYNKLIGLKYVKYITTETFFAYVEWLKSIKFNVLEYTNTLQQKYED